MANILLVEDDFSLRTAYMTILATQKHNIEPATNGLEALEKLKKFKPQIILLDLLMPIMGGLNFLKKYNAPQHPEISIVLLTNMPSSPEVDKCLKLGVRKVAVKSSMAPKDLLDLVDSYI
jgi:two-component system response regulator